MIHPCEKTDAIAPPSVVGIGNLQKVLIVSNDPGLRTVLKTISYEGKECLVCEVETGESAIEEMRANKFDFLFVDGDLPFGRGIALLKKLYSPDSDHAGAPLLFLAAESNEKEVLEALRYGAQDYIFKENLSPAMIGISMTKAKKFFELKSSRHEAEVQLQHTRRMEAIGHLTSGIAHDFNNLLTVVLGNTRLLRRRIEKGAENFSLPDADKKIESIEIAANKGAELIRRMMVFTRQSQLSEEVVDINKCVNETFELLKRTLGETISVDILATEKPWPVSLDSGEFGNALINLAVNARDAMPRGGKLTIETDNVMLDEAYTLSHPDVAAGPYVKIAVSDNGIGMDRETLKRIFEPFFTTKDTGKGSGLGLSMVYGFIRQSQGHIHVYSEPDHGTVFRIYLPRVRVEGDEETETNNLPVPEGKETILVVEDDEDVRIMASNMLERLGYRTLQAPSGRVAFEILKKEHKKIDLVFTDIVMPDGSGIDLVQRMREYYPEVKVLYTSGYSQNAIPDYQLSVGEELISKPYRRELLARKVRKVLDGEGEADQ